MLKERVQPFDRVEWLKKRVPQKKLIDNTVKLKYLLHPAEFNEHISIKKVFDRFDDDGNRTYHYYYLERLEVAEVKHNFDEHKLRVSEKSLAKLFKSAAVNRRRLDPCTELSLYEFCIFSKKASGDFRSLMNNVKASMLSGMNNIFKKKEKGGKEEGRRDIGGIMPRREKAYIQYLPSSFNPLMNHFKDEQNRTGLREHFVTTLNDIMSIGNSKKNLHAVLEKNKEKMSKLLASHFPREETTDLQQLHATHRKAQAKPFRRQSVVITPTNCSPLKISLKKSKGQNVPVRTATVLGKMEVCGVADSRGEKPGVKSYNALNSVPGQVTAKTSRSQMKSSLATRKSFVDSLLAENLVLRSKRGSVVLSKSKAHEAQQMKCKASRVPLLKAISGSLSRPKAPVNIHDMLY